MTWSTSRASARACCVARVRSSSAAATPAERSRSRSNRTFCIASTHDSSWSRTSSSRACRSEEHTSELQSRSDLVCRLLLEKKNRKVRSWRLSFAEGIEGLDLCPKGGKGHGCFAYVPTCYLIARFVGRELCGAREKDQAFRSSRCSRKDGCSSKPGSDHSRLFGRKRERPNVLHGRTRFVGFTIFVEAEELWSKQ